MRIGDARNEEVVIQPRAQLQPKARNPYGLGDLGQRRFYMS